MAMEFTSQASAASSKGFYVTPNGSTTGAFELAACQTNVTYGSVARPAAATWHHLVVTYDFTGATAITAYLNGNSATYTVGGAGTGTNSFFANSTLYLLSRNNASLLGIGNLQDIIIFDRVLTADEVKSLYQNHWQVLRRPQTPVLVSAPAAGGATGTIAVTLAAFTSAITGTTTVTGSAAPTLAAFTSAITGTVTVPGTIAVTLADHTSSMSGTPTVPGTIAATLDDSTSSISGSVGNAVSGTIAATLAAFTSAITGTTSVVGTLAAVLSAFTSAVQGTTTVVGSMAATLANFTADMYGAVASSSVIRRVLRFARGCFGRKALDQ